MADRAGGIGGGGWGGTMKSFSQDDPAAAALKVSAQRRPAGGRTECACAPTEGNTKVVFVQWHELFLMSAHALLQKEIQKSSYFTVMSSFYEFQRQYRGCQCFKSTK